MDRWHPSLRPQKEDARNYAFEGVGFRRRSLWLPGEGCHCVKSAAEQGIITYESQLILVERDPAVARIINRWSTSRAWTKPPFLWNGELHRLRLSNDLDYAFLDMMGQFDSQTYLWLADELSPRLAPGASVAVTNKCHWRNNSLLEILSKSLPKDFLSLCRRLDIYRPWMRTLLFSYFCAFRDFRFTVEPPTIYKDGRNPMVLFRFDNLRRSEPQWPDLNDFKEREEVMAKRSAAALKAWETRRANKSYREVAANGSEAALKAWKTRRANIAAAKRRAAALKAWKTRRANGN